MQRFRELVDIMVIKEMMHMVWSKIRLSRLTAIYFGFSLAHCIIQVLFQGQAFQTNANAANLIATILHTANATSPGFALLEEDLYWCKGLPQSGSWQGSGCVVVWKGNSAERSTYSADSNDGESMGQAYSSDSSTDQLTSTQSAPASSITVAPPSITNNVIASASKPPQVTVTQFVRPSPSTVVKRTPQPPHDPFLTSDPLFPKTTKQKRSAQPPHDPFLTSDPLFPKVSDAKRSISILVTSSSITSGPDNQTVTTITGLPNAPQRLVLDQTCLVALNWPLETLDNTKREDITFIIFHIWVLGMSIVGLLNESIPHMLASLLTHVAVTGWSAFQLTHTRNFQNNFSHFITNGACVGQNLLPTYWRDRANAEIPSAALNGLALIVSAVLTYKLIKTYNWATFKRIGASRKISRVYKIVLTLSVVLQLSVFFIVTSMALWIDQLCNGVIGKFASNMTLYRVGYVVVLLLLVPWIVIGWKAARMEMRTLMHIFLGFNVVLIGGWASMFAAITFRWTFIQWRFFSIISSLAVSLSLVTLVLGILCRRNFGTDLPKYLNGQSRVQDDEEFVSASDDYGSKSFKDSERWSATDFEKISFPSAGPVPTFGATFGSNAPSRSGSNLSSNTSISNPFGSSQSSVRSGSGSANSPVSLTTPPAARIAGQMEWERDPRRISIGSAHSASTIDLPRKNKPLPEVGEGDVKQKGSGGKKLNKRWVIE